MKVDSISFSLLRIQGGCLRRDSYTTKAPPPCNCSPLIFGIWAAGQSSRNVNLYWWFILCSKELINSNFVSSFIWDKCHSSVILCSCSSNSTFKTTLPQTFVATLPPNLHRPLTASQLIYLVSLLHQLAKCRKWNKTFVGAAPIQTKHVAGSFNSQSSS